MSKRISSKTLGLAILAGSSLVTLAACGGGSGGGEAKAPSREAQSVLPTKSNPGIEIVGEAPPGVAERARKILGLAVKARHLAPKTPVKLETLAPTALVGVVKKHVDAEIPKDEIRAEGRTFADLGLVPAGYDLEAETYALLEEQLAGLYIPENKTMYLSQTVPGDEVESTLAHELVHALQDQHFELGVKMKFRHGASDELSALSSLAEGDATVAMFDEMILAKQGERALASHDTSQVEDVDAFQFLDSTGGKAGMTKLSSAPRFIALGLVAPYADGMSFVNGLRRRGGWRAVDAAWSHPPTSTEQLLHLDRYLASEAAVMVQPATTTALGAGWKKSWDDVFGEQEMRLAFSVWMDPKTAMRAAEGWGGDRVTLLEADGGKSAVAWSMAFDDEANAKEAHAALVEGWSALLGQPQTITTPFEIVAYGLPTPVAAPKDPKAKDPKAKDPKAKDPKAASGLPELPDPKAKANAKSSTPPSGLPDLPDPTPPGAKPAPKAISIPKGCRAIARNGRMVTIVTTPTCDATVAWAAEVAKITP
jgi:hypothetical protein